MREADPVVQIHGAVEELVAKCVRRALVVDLRKQAALLAAVRLQFDRGADTSGRAGLWNRTVIVGGADGDLDRRADVEPRVDGRERSVR